MMEKSDTEYCTENERNVRYCSCLEKKKYSYIPELVKRVFQEKEPSKETFRTTMSGRRKSTICDEQTAGVGIDMQFPQTHQLLELSSGGTGAGRCSNAKEMPPRVSNK